MRHGRESPRSRLCQGRVSVRGSSTRCVRNPPRWDRVQGPFECDRLHHMGSPARDDAGAPGRLPRAPRTVDRASTDPCGVGIRGRSAFLAAERQAAHRGVQPILAVGLDPTHRRTTTTAQGISTLTPKPQEEQLGLSEDKEKEQQYYNDVEKDTTQAQRDSLPYNHR